MKNNQNVKGNGNTVENTQIINGVQPVAKINEVERNPVMIMGKQAKTSWLFIGTAVGFLANLATIYPFIKNFSINNGPSIIVRFIPMSICLICLYMFIALTQKRLLKLGPLMIANHEGKLFHVKYQGICPCCEGKLTFTSDKEGNGIALCMANDTHQFSFSPKMFDQHNYA